jgi:hypothetical protein
MFCILIVTPPPDDEAAAVDVDALELVALLVVELLEELLLELPQPAAASATTAQSASRIRVMFITTPPRVVPS